MTLSNLFLVVAVVLFVLAGVNLHLLDTTSDVELIGIGLAFFAGSFLVAGLGFNRSVG